MKIPRNVTGSALASALRQLGYSPTRQTDSHIRLTKEAGGVHHITVPNHSPIRVGTLSGILKAIAAHHKMTLADLVRVLRL